MKTVSFYTLGCRLNQSETAVLENSFAARGVRVVAFTDPADAVVINTCTVTENGDSDTRRLVRRVARLNPRARIALVGCQAQIQKEQLLALPNVHWVVGNARKMELAEILTQDPGGAPQVIAPPIPRTPFTISVPGIDLRHTRANIKIQDGCDFFCSFCEIPFARGRARSREFADIQQEARALAAAGHQEIVITGINVGTYQDGDRTIADVVRAMDDIPGLARVRISSIEPTTIPGELLEMMARHNGRLCRHLHIPLQSAHDDVLRAMKRQYTAAEALDFIRRAAEQVPGLCVGTDIIVGFPGETEAQFQATYEALEAAPVHHWHVFSYSERRRAPSRHRTDAVPAREIQRRSARLRALAQRKRAAFYAAAVGQEVDVLFETVKSGWWEGLTDNYIRVRVPSEKPLANTFARVKVTALEGTAVRGDLVA